MLRELEIRLAGLAARALASGRDDIRYSEHSDRFAAEEFANRICVTEQAAVKLVTEMATEAMDSMRASWSQVQVFVAPRRWNRFLEHEAHHARLGSSACR